MTLFTAVAEGSAADRIRAAGVSITTSPSAAPYSRETLRALRALIRQVQPDIIHGAVFEGAALASLAGTLERVPIIVTEETSEATNRSWRGHAIFRAIVSFSDQVVAISDQVAHDLVAVTAVPARKVRVITNGVEPYPIPTDADRRAARSQWHIPADAPVIGTMCRLVDDSHKRVSDVIRAMPHLLEAYPSLTLLVCGEGRVQPMLEELARELGVEASVVFAGNVPDPSVGFAAMDVFVHVAAREGFGLAVAEAAFCALPIVTTGVGGIASIVVPDETALIVPVGDPEAIATAVGQLLDDPSLRTRLGHAGRQRALERFSAQRYVQDVEAMYRDLMTEHGLL